MISTLKSKWIVCILVLCMALGIFAGCNKDNAPENGGSGGGHPDNEFVNSSSERKIIYTASISLEAQNPESLLNEIKAVLPAGSWADLENLSSERAYVVFRVKTEKFDEFVVALSKKGTVLTSEKTATDVTSSYSSLQEDKATLQAEKDRLVALMENATATEIITIINPRITEIEKRILEVNRQLSQTDSLLEYSKVVVSIYASGTVATSFGQKIKDSFSKGLDFAENIFLLFVTTFFKLLPIGLIGLAGAGVTFGIVKIVGKIKKQKNDKNPKN